MFSNEHQHGIQDIELHNSGPINLTYPDVTKIKVRNGPQKCIKKLFVLLHLGKAVRR